MGSNRDLLAHLVRASAVPKASWVHRDLPVRWDLQVSLVRWDLPVNLVRWDLPVISARLDLMVSLGLWDLQVRWENAVSLVR